VAPRMHAATRTVALARGDVTVVPPDRTSLPDAVATLTIRPTAASSAVIVRGFAAQVTDWPGGQWAATHRSDAARARHDHVRDRLPPSGHGTVPSDR
jgi:hypothetical protein